MACWWKPYCPYLLLWGVHVCVQSLKQHFDKATHGLQQSVQEVTLQLRTSAVASSAPPALMHQASMASGASNGSGGGLEDSLRSAFARPAMRALPSFRPHEPSLDKSGVAAAITVFGSSNGRGTTQLQVGPGVFTLRQQCRMAGLRPSIDGHASACCSQGNVPGAP